MQLRLIKADWHEVKNHGRLLIPGLVVDIADYKKGVQLVRPEYVLQYQDIFQDWIDVEVVDE